MSKSSSGHGLKDFRLVNKNGLEILFTGTGSFQTISYKNIMINQLRGNNIDSCFNNIYLRIIEGKNVSFLPIIGRNSVFAISVDHNTAFWKGNFNGVEYICSCNLNDEENMWLWDIELRNTTENNIETDIVYVQDLGLADKNAVRTNEAYISQYIDHTVVEEKEYGCVICSRQNLPQNVDKRSSFPWIVQGAFSKVTGYLTDGFQFYGLEYKDTNIPGSLKCEKLNSSKLQYEIAMVCMQTEKVYLEKETSNKILFYAYFLPDHEEPSNDMDLELVYKIKKICCSTKKHHENLKYRPLIEKNIFENAVLFEAEKFSDKDIDLIFGEELIHEELIDEKLVSFFYGNNKHVVLKEKEFHVERPHGHIMMSGCNADFNEVKLSTTSYIYGLFNSLVSIGNTSFSRIISGARNPLNAFKSCGQRIFAKINGEYKLLALPSSFEIGKNYCCWLYKLRDVIIKVTSWTGVVNTACYLDIEILNSDKKYEFLISHEIVAGSNERDSIPEIRFDNETGITVIKPNTNEVVASKYPNTVYCISPENKNGLERVGGSELLYEGNKNIFADEPYVVYVTKKVSSFKLKIFGSLSGDITSAQISDFENYEEAVNQNDNYWNELINNFSLEFKGENKSYSKINDIIKCYSHNAMVHFLIPHGLEQNSGAAWGVRDVCQGPVEFFLSTNNFKPVRKIILSLFAHQYKQRGDWPQWYMFDEFYKFQQRESHGDVILWPLKALFDYIEVSGDFKILYENISLTDIDSLEFTNQKCSVIEHVKILVDSIKKNFIKGTFLSCYGDGDWDDTLQPADIKYKKNTVSGWTVLLTYQVFRKAAAVLEKFNKGAFAEELCELSGRIRKDYNKYIIKDEVAAGFLYFKPDNTPEVIIHPLDKRTGIHYRLLPMIRGIISELFTKEQMKNHFRIIKDHLYCPDGVRLMDNPAQYIGGPNRFFMRAEQAANFGREIGLQYVHAHIRFIEAMAKIGNAEEVYKGLLTINPINISSFVKNAKTRQSNTYFSSSDGDFADRYSAQENFEKLKVGSVGVKGGWRIYSSGPGIYINQVISNMLGIRFKNQSVEIDPVIPKSLNGLIYNFTYENKKIKVCYHTENGEYAPQSVKVNSVKMDFQRIENPYREGGVEIYRTDFDKLLNKEENTIDVFI